MTCTANFIALAHILTVFATKYSEDMKNIPALFACLSSICCKMPSMVVVDLLRKIHGRLVYTHFWSLIERSIFVPVQDK